MNDPGLDGPIQDISSNVTGNLRRKLSDETTGSAAESTAAAEIRHELKADQEEEDLGYSQSTMWWFTSTAFPLIAGTFGPLANLFSICALAQTWRIQIEDGSSELHGDRVPDPPWLLALNAVSLAAACVANIFLLLNFAHRVRYSVAQSFTIILWYISAILLIIPLGRTRELVIQPTNDHAFSQAYYYGIIAAALYTIISTLLLWNVLGAWHFKAYPASFNPLTLPQRTLMLQTVSYTLYLAMGAGIFSAAEGWNYLDGLYWCDYTLLTIGLGSDFSPSTTLGRALLIPYAAIGIMMIGLIVGSVRGLVLERGKVKVGRRVLGRQRDKRIGEMKHPEAEWKKREFEAMRRIEKKSKKIQQYSALGISFLAYLVLWCGGALVFWFSEKRPQQLTYFQALYFAYTTLLTVGFGDIYPQSNSGKPFFVVWSLMAVPTVTILISNLGETLVDLLKVGTIWIGQKTILPEHSQDKKNEKGKKEKRQDTHKTSPQGRRQLDPSWNPEKEARREGLEKDVEKLGHAVEHAEEERGEPRSLLARLASEISNVAKDLNSNPPRQYEWDEWQKFLRLIGSKELKSGMASTENKGEEEVDWSWLGDEGPLFSTMTEPEWVLEKLCTRMEKEIEHRDS